MRPSDYDLSRSLDNFAAGNLEGSYERRSTPWISTSSTTRSFASSQNSTAPRLASLAKASSFSQRPKRIVESESEPSAESESDASESFVSSDDSDDRPRKKSSKRSKSKAPIKSARRSQRVVEAGGRKRYIDDTSADESSPPRRVLRKGGRALVASSDEESASIVRLAQQRNGGLSSEDEDHTFPPANEASRMVDSELSGSETPDASQNDVPEEPYEVVEKILARRKVGKHYEFFTKFRCRSYRHCRWESSDFFVDTENDRRATKLKNFQTKHPQGDTVSTFQSFFNPIFLNVDRVLAHRNLCGGACLRPGVCEHVEALIKWEGLSYSESTWESVVCLVTKDTGESFKQALARFEKLNNPDRLALRKTQPVRARVQAPHGASAAQDFANNLICTGEPEDGDLSKRTYYYDKSLSAVRSRQADQPTCYQADATESDRLSIFDFQKEGVEWLLYNWLQGRGSILADEMGLGKTVQSSIMLSEMSRFCQSHRGANGESLFLIVAPLSVLSQWQRELAKWSDLEAVVFHGNARDRSIIVKYEFQGISRGSALLSDLLFGDENGSRKDATLPTWTPDYLPSSSHPKFDVCVTSYETLASEPEAFNSYLWTCVVLDESHKLKGTESKARETVAALPCKHRLLLTGTPIQNNLGELWSLLNLCSRTVWPDKEQFLSEFALKTAADTEALQRKIQPFLLQRKKAAVMAHLMPKKEETVVSVELSRVQRETYRAVYEKNLSVLLAAGSFKGKIVPPQQMNVHMELRKCCNHPFLISGIEDRILGGQALYSEDGMRRLISSSGKMVFLEKLLLKLISEGEKLLIFSQFTMMLDLIEDFLRWQGYAFERLDGAVDARTRQEAVDRFNDKRPSATARPFVFLLSTKAGGVGLNLTAASVVLLFDQDYNPQNDLQAQARSHRIGQKKQVRIFRLVTRGTYEEHMFKVASQKLGLEQAVMSNVGGSKSEKLSREDMDMLLRQGAYALLDDETEQQKFCEADIDDILRTRTTKIVEGAEQSIGNLSGFSKALFQVNDSAGQDAISANDPLFWQKIAQAGNFGVPKEVEEFEEVQQPRRKLVKQKAEDESDDEQTVKPVKETIESKRLALAVKFLVSFSLWDHYPTWESKFVNFMSEKWQKRAPNQIQAAAKIETNLRDEIVMYFAAFFRALQVLCPPGDRAALEECARTLVLKQVVAETCLKSELADPIDFLQPLPNLSGNMFADLSIPDYIVKLVPSSFATLRGQLMEMEAVCIIRELSKQENPKVFESKKSRMQPDWWTEGSDDAALLRCVLEYGKEDCSARMMIDAHFASRIGEKFQKQFILYRVDKLVPKWWPCRTQLMTEVLVAHGLPSALLSRVFKASAYPWVKKFAQADVLAKLLEGSTVSDLKVGPSVPVAVEDDEQATWKFLHSKLPKGFPLTPSDLTDYGKALLLKVLLVLGTKNSDTEKAVRAALKVSKANEELTEDESYCWPSVLNRDQAFAILWRWQAMFFIKTGGLTRDEVDHAAVGLGIEGRKANDIIQFVSVNGLDGWEGHAGLTRTAIRICCAVLTSRNSEVSASKRSADGLGSPDAKKPKKQQTLLGFVSSKKQEE